MKFWRIRSPEYEFDYKDSYVNGSLEHPFDLPDMTIDQVMEKLTVPSAGG
jgi:hypothetical protein